MNFRDKICEHLNKYRVDHLKVHEDGEFHYKGETYKKRHILSSKTSNLNLIESYRDQFLLIDNINPIKRHRYFHHLNSSQAMCLNLFFPLISENQLSVYLNYLEIDKIGDLKPAFEKESDIENAKRKTSFDFYIKNGNKSEVFVEVKYTEDGFGKVKYTKDEKGTPIYDREHIEKFIKTYMPLLIKSKFLNPICSEMDFFLNHYQILRNLVHLSENSHVIFLFPRDNLKVAKQAEFARDYCINDAGKERFKIVYLEDLMEFFENKFYGENLGSYYQSFRKKYLPISTAQI